MFLLRLHLFALLATTALVGCGALGGEPRRPLANFAAPERGDGGQELTRATMIPGATRTTGKVGSLADCYGPGLGVEVETVRGSTTMLFGNNGEECPEANVLFDGARPSGQRQADPTVAIWLHDAYGAMLDERLSEDLPTKNSPLQIHLGREAITATSPTAPTLPSAAVPGGIDPLTTTLQTWQQSDSRMETLSGQAASSRELNRLVAQAANQSSGEAANALAAQLREQERALELERRRHEETLKTSAQNRAMTQAQRDAWQQEQNRLQAELLTAKERASQFEQLASRLQTEKERKEAAMGERIATLSGSLKLAEQQAEVSRRELILQAAAKVAEAQALATAAKLDTQNDQLAEASRLHAQANELMDQVLLTRGEGAIEPAAGAAKADLPLTDAPIVLQAKERTLPDILTEILQQAAPHSGAWRAEWQLGDKGQNLLAERWSLTAEATVGQILANLNMQVQEAHGLTLKFAPFTQTRVLVITEAGAVEPNPKN
jgi:hypothetical protein